MQTECLLTWNWNVDGVTEDFMNIITAVQAVIINGNTFESQEWNQSVFIVVLCYFYIVWLIDLITEACVQCVSYFTPGDI